MLLTLLLMMVLDAIWIMANISRYQGLVRDVQKSDMDVRVSGAVCAYAVMVAAVLFVVIPNAKRDKGTLLKKSLKHGALIGFVIYAIFNATNYALFKNYNLITGVLDTLWGTFLFFAITFFYLQFDSFKH